MLPIIKELAKKRGVTVKCKPSTEKINYSNNYGWQMDLNDKFKKKNTGLVYPGQSEMVCRDLFGEVLSTETSFNLPIFEAWILSDRCSLNKKFGNCLEGTGRY